MFIDLGDMVSVCKQSVLYTFSCHQCGQITSSQFVIQVLLLIWLLSITHAMNETKIQVRKWISGLMTYFFWYLG